MMSSLFHGGYAPNCYAGPTRMKKTLTCLAGLDTAFFSKK